MTPLSASVEPAASVSEPSVDGVAPLSASVVPFATETPPSAPTPAANVVVPEPVKLIVPVPESPFAIVMFLPSLSIVPPSAPTE